MALGNIGKPNNQLLDTLLQLNELVSELKGQEFTALINELKDKTAEFNAAKSAAIPTINALSEEKQLHEKALNEAKSHKAMLDGAKQEHENRLQKIQKATDALDLREREHANKIKASHAELDQKSQTIDHREQRAVERQKQADAIKDEYEKKLADLKKITG